MDTLDRKTDEIAKICLMCLEEEDMTEDSRVDMLLGIYGRMTRIQQESCMLQQSIRFEMSKLNLKLNTELNLTVEEIESYEDTSP